MIAGRRTFMVLWAKALLVSVRMLAGRENDSGMEPPLFLGILNHPTDYRARPV
jgi:hypothetical protein